uniref:protein-tyrosine-phosphatase n=1 Tax=Amphora coffeiformis TaxID=265554 RepID=A0A7S3L959_9STRA|eukprot:scaffold5479_cov199-Amphora_coffeaeformis.AAC.23
MSVDSNLASYDGTTHVETQRRPETFYNFGPASSRDEIVFTCERPGADPEGGGKIPTTAVVQEWATFMKSKGIQRVLVLLSDGELGDYEEPGLLQCYTDLGFQVYRNPMGVEGSAPNAAKLLKEAERANEKVVAHCTHGKGRSGRVAAGWLIMRYGLSPQEATREAVQTAVQFGMERMGDAKLLEEWLNR